MVRYTSRYALPERLRKGQADDRALTLQSVLSAPYPDLAGDIVDPAGLDFSPHAATATIDLEHRRDPAVRGLPVAWARPSLKKAGPYHHPVPTKLNFGTDDEPEWHVVPVATEWFDPGSKLSMQVFALCRSDAFPGRSLEFSPVGGYAKALGRSPLEDRPAYHFRKALVHCWTVCAQPVCEQALQQQVVTKSVRQVPPAEAMVRVLRDQRVNVGGRWEDLLPELYKALAPTDTPKKATVSVPPLREAVIAKARQPFHGGYWEDNCPECGAQAKSGCRCVRNDRWCTNGHVWERLRDGSPVLLDRGHGRVIKAYGGQTIAQAEANRKGWPRKQPVEKAMDDEMAPETTSTLEAQTEGPEDAAAEAPASNGVTALYDHVQAAGALVEKLKADLANSDNPQLISDGRRAAEQMEKLLAKIAILAEKHDAKIQAAMGGEASDDAAEPDDEGDEPLDDEYEPDDEAVAKALARDADGVLVNVCRPVYRKALVKGKRFTPAEIQKGQEAQDSPEDLKFLAEQEARFQRALKYAGK
ncbi:MAG: hypothetical protein E6Q76_02965 [Rhizobium sp.]|nr:MAG: hypothetical protein E6Q76_02965 [Rhizobium sp.]